MSVKRMPNLRIIDLDVCGWCDWWAAPGDVLCAQCRSEAPHIADIKRLTMRMIEQRHGAVA